MTPCALAFAPLVLATLVGMVPGLIGVHTLATELAITPHTCGAVQALASQLGRST